MHFGLYVDDSWTWYYLVWTGITGGPLIHYGTSRASSDLSSMLRLLQDVARP